MLQSPVIMNSVAEERIADQILQLADRIGRDAFLDVCLNLMKGADRNLYVQELRSLTGHAWAPGDSVFDPQSWPDYWVRTWGARGLLHVWDDRATDAVVHGLSDEHWRPAEMCLKIAARHDVAGTADGAAKLLNHPLPRVRTQALRALSVVGDTEHFELVKRLAEAEDASVRQQANRTLDAMRRRLDILS